MPSPRRTSVAKHPGIYYRVGADGNRRYEISYTDSKGKRRWKVVDGGLREAEAARADVRGRLRRGERVAPSKATLQEVADAWLASQAELRPRTYDNYRSCLKLHVYPRFGRLRIAELTEDHVAQLIAEMREGLYFRRERTVRDPETRKLVPDESSSLVRVKRSTPFAGWTVRGVLTPLSRVMAYAVRRGMAAANPVAKLERGERPPVSRREMRILERAELASLLTIARERYRPLLATAAFTGLRISELLGLTWADVDFDAELVRVRKQLGRDGVRVEPKTEKAKRDVVMMPALGRILREHKLRSGFSASADPVFASLNGTPLQGRNVARRGLEKAIAEAELDGEGKAHLRMHDLRHTFASLLIAQGADVVFVSRQLAQGADVVFVSRQLGHANPSITLSVYAHLFDRARHADETRDVLEAEFGGLLDGVGTGHGTEPTLRAANGGHVGTAEVVTLGGFSD